MQAIILAAGMGKRLGELTKDNTKCMVEVNGVKLIDRVISQLIPLHLNRLIIVVGFQGKKLMEHIGNRYDGLIDIMYVENPIYDRTNNIYSLALAKDLLCEDDTLLLESDLIFEDSLLQMIVNHPDPNLALVAKYETWMDGTMVTIDSDRNILNFIPKKAFRYEDVDVYYKTVNIYKFSRRFSCNEYVPFLEAYSKAMGNNEYYEQVLRILTLVRETAIKALPIGDRKWYEIDDIQDLDIASAIFSSDETKYHEYRKRQGGYWRFPSIIDFSDTANPYFPPAKLINEMKANFATLICQYPSDQAVISLLGGKIFGIRQEYITVGNGVSELINTFAKVYSPKHIGIISAGCGGSRAFFPDSEIHCFHPSEDNFKYSAAAIISYFSSLPLDSLLITNPDSETGNFIPFEEIMELCEWCGNRGITMLVDESLVDFTDNFRHNSLLHNNILQDHSNLCVLKSLSKSYGVPGMRIGVLASSDTPRISAIKKTMSTWNINSVAEFFLQNIGKYDTDYLISCDKFIRTRRIFHDMLNKIPYLKTFPGQGNFFLCEITSGLTGDRLSRILLNHGILIGTLPEIHSSDKREYVKIGILSEDENQKLIDILKSIKP